MILRRRYRYFLLIFICLLIFPFFPQIFIYSSRNSIQNDLAFNSRKLETYQLNYQIEGIELDLNDDGYSLGQNFRSTIKLNMNLTNETINIKYYELYQTSFKTFHINKLIIIDSDTEKDQSGNYPFWILIKPTNTHLFSTNFSTQTFLFYKLYPNAIYLDAVKSIVLCNVYCYSINFLDETIRICYYFDVNSGILIKYSVFNIKNLIETEIITCKLISSDYSDFKNVNYITGFIYNYYILIISIITGIFCGIITFKILVMKKQGDLSF